MLAGGIPFVLYVQAMLGEPAMLWRHPQVRTLLAGVAAVVLILTFWLWLERGMAPLTALRYSAFNLVSIVTTTGFATTGYNLWGGFALLVFFFLTFVGGCTGSTAGGIKIFRDRKSVV